MATKKEHVDKHTHAVIGTPCPWDITNSWLINRQQVINARATTILKLNSKHSDVITLKKQLVNRFFLIMSCDDKFDIFTECAVIRFQSKNRLNPNGIVDANTWRKLGVTFVEKVSDKVTVTPQKMMFAVYKAFRNAGFSEAQSKALTAEVGRENDYNEEKVFGTHDDQANSLKNTGFFSWQGSRSDELKKKLAEKGLLDKSGQMFHSQESLNEMAKFAIEEMRSGQYKGLGNFMKNKDVDSETAAKQLGKGYVKWAYGQNKLSNGKDFNWKQHDVKRAGYYKQIDAIVKDTNE